MIHIACNIDEKFVPHCGVMLTSLLFNNPDADISIHVIAETLSEDGQDTLRGIVERRFRQRLFFYLVGEKCLARFPDCDPKSHISMATNYRLFVADFLPEEIEKVIYLDCDLFVMGSIQELWDTDLGDAAVAAVEDMWSGKAENYTRLDYPKADSYFNAGVLLINLKEWRRMDFGRKSVDFLLHGGKELPFMDQDILNALLHDRKRWLPFRWNVQDGLLRRRRKVNPASVPALDEELKHPVIIHFTGHRKPWHYYCLNPYRELYFTYVDKTQWRGKRPTVPFSYRLKRMLDEVLTALHLKARRYRDID